MNPLEAPIPKTTPSETLLETILLSCDEERYLVNFRDNNIDLNVLRNLVDEDLLMIGITNEGSRKTILEHFQNLQIPTERKLNIDVDNSYASLVLNQSSVQFKRHYLNLAYVLSCANKNDVDLYYISLGQAGKTLNKCLDSFDKEIKCFKKEVFKETKKRKSKRLLILISTIGAFGLIVLSFIKLNKVTR